MAVSVETLLTRSDARLGAVHPRIREYSLELIRRAYKEGIRVQISSGFRANTEQAHIYGQGRPSYVWNGKKYGRAGNVVSNARPGSSVHNYGLAIDYFLVSEDGNSSIWVVNNQWRRVAAIAKSMGFEWGGDWKSFRDYPHLQITRGLSIAQLAAGRLPSLPALSGTTPVPAVNKPITKDYLTYDDRGHDVEMLQTYLTKVGFPVEVMGYYNAATRKAVMDFQNSRGLEGDGIYGPVSKAEMNKALKEPPKQVETPVVKPPASVAVQEPKPEEMEELELTKRQREELAATFEKARDRGVFSSDEHEKAILDGTMTQSELLYLTALIAGASLVGGERIKQG